MPVSNNKDGDAEDGGGGGDDNDDDDDDEDDTNNLTPHTQPNPISTQAKPNSRQAGGEV